MAGGRGGGREGGGPKLALMPPPKPASPQLSQRHFEYHPSKTATMIGGVNPNRDGGRNKSKSLGQWCVTLIWVTTDWFILGGGFVVKIEPVIKV